MSILIGVVLVATYAFFEVVSKSLMLAVGVILVVVAAVTLTLIVWGVLLAPPVPVLPWSLILSDIVSAPT